MEFRGDVNREETRLMGLLSVLCGESCLTDPPV